MNLTFHHFRKDVRQFRLLLSIWFGLLLLDLAVNLGWVGNVEYSPSRGFDTGSNTWTRLLPIMLWAFAGILPSLVVLTDSPARHEGFLATRPVRMRELLVAKLLFVLGLIVLPRTVAEVLYLTMERLPTWAILQGTLEQSLILLPVTFACGAFAALWPSTARWARALAIGFGCFICFGTLYSFSVQVLHVTWFRGLDRAPGVFGAYISVFTLLVFAAWHAQANRSWRFRWLGLFGCLLAGWLSGFIWQAQPHQLRPENPAAAKAVVAAAGLRIPTSGVLLGRVSDSEKLDQKKFNLSLLPEMKPLPEAEVIEWSGKEPHLIRPNGSEIAGGGRTSYAPLFRETYWNQATPFEEVAAWATWFPTNIMFRHSEYGPVSYPVEMTFNGFSIPESPAELSQNLKVKVALEARVFQWRKIADLSLTPGATATNDFGSWEIKSIQPRKEIAAAELYLERRQIELLTAEDSRCSSAYGGPLIRMKLMIYDPLDQTAWLPDSYAMNAATRATHTGFVRHFVLFSLNGRPPFTTEEIARLRLVILEKSWIGSVPQQWESDAFTLESKLSGLSGVANYGNSQDRLSRSALNRRLAALNVPPVDASRREISLYLLEYFRLLDAHGSSIDSGSPEVARLARFVPTQLNLLLEGLPAMGWVSKNAVLSAIETGALEEQKYVLIAALHSQPELAEVLLKRGWSEDAAPELYEAIQSNSSVPFSLFQAVALFQDPQTFPWLLNTFDRQPSVSADDLLHRLGLGKQAGEIVRGKWYRNKLIWRPGSPMFDEVFTLALKHGDFSALQRAFLVEKRMHSNDPQFGLVEGIREAVQVTDLSADLQPEDRAVADWMRKHQPEDFVFSPARRQFVLKSATNSVAAASPRTNP